MLAKHCLLRLAKPANITVKGTSEILSLPFSNDNIWQLPSAYMSPTLHRPIHRSGSTSQLGASAEKATYGFCNLVHT